MSRRDARRCIRAAIRLFMGSPIAQALYRANFVRLRAAPSAPAAAPVPLWKWREMQLAFAMGPHRRCGGGADCMVFWLQPELVHTILVEASLDIMDWRHPGHYAHRDRVWTERAAHMQFQTIF